MDQDVTWYGARSRPRRLCVRWGPRSFPQKGAEPSQIFGPCLLRPNSWMDEAGTWHGGRPQPRRLCVRWGPCSPSPKGGRSIPQIVGPCLLRPNGWMDEAGTWHGGRPQPRRLCVRWGPSPLPPKRGGIFSAHFYCGQTAAILKFYFRFQLQPASRHQHLILRRHTKFHVNQTIGGVVMTSLKFSTWRPLTARINLQFRIGSAHVLRRSGSLSVSNLVKIFQISIHG